MTLPPTNWQVASQCVRLCVEGARQELDEREWAPFVELVLQLATREAQKLVIAEAIRALREEKS